MDYEKLHKDTIAKLQEMVNSGKITVETACGICADFVPESEDERIMKEIIEYISTADDKELIPYESWIAWLEKQCEQKPDDNVESTTQRHITPNQKFFQWIYDRLIYVHNENPNVDYMLSLKERIKDMQKPFNYEKAHIQQNDFALANKTQEVIIHAWSEEDEKRLNGVISDITVIKANAYSKEGEAAYQREIDWLKSLKDRVQPQPKQEWSKEDENHVKSILSTIECCKTQFPNTQAVIETYNTDIVWLKSLRPQSQWKPSDEQMSILWDALCTLKHDNYKHLEIVKSLYQDLKKLREE